MTAPTFERLRAYYKSGRAYTISGTGRNRVTGYRHSVRCALGDIEESVWYELVREVIQRRGEQGLYEDLLHHLKNHNYTKQSRAELEHYALELHAARIFDNPEWVDFLKFNRQYRPEALEGANVVWIQTECCPRPGQITQVLVDKNPITAPCPHCGRWAPYEILTNYEMEEHK